VAQKNYSMVKKCKFCGNEFPTKSIGSHTVFCHSNPKRDETILKISKRKQGIKMSDEVKKRVSNSMKLAHKENRAWNIGKSRWKNEPSHPERFFCQVIENEFDDKNFIREFPFGIYSLDFAWPHKKLVIEIDGEQHKRFDDYKQRDIRKDEYLKSQGWEILRVEFSYLFNKTKECIKMCLDFVHSSSNQDTIQEYEYWKEKKKKDEEIQTQKKLEKIRMKKEKIEGIISTILTSDIDFSKLGWVTKVGNIIGITPQKVGSWMKKNMKDFYQEKCYKRN
jgi:very-short-patch-repair endonuclease